MCESDSGLRRGRGLKPAFSGEAGWFGLKFFLCEVARLRVLIFLRRIRVPITGGEVEDRPERPDDVGHEPGKRAQHGLQQGLAG